MRLSLARLRPLHLALASVAYWVGLAVVKLGAAIAAAWQVTRCRRVTEASRRT